MSYIIEKNVIFPRDLYIVKGYPKQEKYVKLILFNNFKNSNYGRGNTIEE